MAEGMTLEEQAQAAQVFLQGLMAEFGFDATVETRTLDEETVELAANGDDLGLLVGPRGSTLAALQDVTRTVVQRQFPSRPTVSWSMSRATASAAPPRCSVSASRCRPR